VNQLLDHIGIGPIYWSNIRNGHKVVGKKRALEFARVSAQLVGPNKPHLTVIDMIGLRHEMPKLVGKARGPAVIEAIPDLPAVAPEPTEQEVDMKDEEA
jgi:hypothetical protein